MDLSWEGFLEEGVGQGCKLDPCVTCEVSKERNRTLEPLSREGWSSKERASKRKGSTTTVSFTYPIPVGTKTYTSESPQSTTETRLRSGETRRDIRHTYYHCRRDVLGDTHSSSRGRTGFKYVNHVPGGT